MQATEIVFQLAELENNKTPEATARTKNLSGSVCR